MARRTRRFESLEERRLLAAVMSSPDTAAMVAAASPASPSPSQTAASAGPSQPAASSGGSSSGAWSNASPDANSGDANSGASGAASASAADGTYGSYSEYATSGTSDQYTNSASSEYSPSTTSTPVTATSSSSDTASQTAQAAAVQVLQSAQSNATSGNAQAVIAVPGGTLTAPATSAPGGPVRFEAHDLVARRELDDLSSDSAASVAIADGDAQLVAPVAWAMWGEQRVPLVAETDAGDDVTADALADFSQRPVVSGSPQPAALIAGAIGADWAYLEHSVDKLFERLERLGEELPSATTARHVGECVVLTAGAAAAFEYVRAQLREGGSWQAFVDGGREPWEPRLRRRWFRRRAESGSQR